MGRSAIEQQKLTRFNLYYEKLIVLNTLLSVFCFYLNIVMLKTNQLHASEPTNFKVVL